MRPGHHALFIALCTAFVGCRGSASAKAHVNTPESTEEANFDEPTPEQSPSAVTAPAASAAEAPPMRDTVLLGARHDLRLANAGAETTCNCLHVALGQAGDPSFAWRSGAPSTDASSQLVIALSSEGISCPAAPKDSQGASYWGYRQVGDNVVVIVEAARAGRPITPGAIIPKPIGHGQVYVQPLARDVPYGRPAHGSNQLCSAGNPGPARPAPPNPPNPSNPPAAEDDSETE